MYVFANVHDSGVLLSEALLSVGKECGGSWVCSGNSFPLHQLRRKAARSSHLSDHTFCPVCCGSDMSGSFVQLNATYNIPMGFTDPLWRRVDTSLVLSHWLDGLPQCHFSKMWRCSDVQEYYQLWRITTLKISTGLIPEFIKLIIKYCRMKVSR